MDCLATQSRIGSVISSKTFAIAVTIFALLAAEADAFEVVGHRGARGLRPENTIPAFVEGAAVGATEVEMDVTLTRDRHVIVSHDPRVSPGLCTGGYANRRYRYLTLAQVRQLDCGTRHVADWLARTELPVPGAHVPTLGQVYRVVPARTRLLVEPKTDPYVPGDSFAPETVAASVVAVIQRAHGERRTTVQSFDWRVLRDVHRLAPRLRLQVLASDDTVYRGSAWVDGARVGHHPFLTGLTAAVEHEGFAAVAVPAGRATPLLIGSAHGRGLKLLAYTVDAPAKMARLIALGVDGLVSDFPDRLAGQVRAAGLGH